MRGVVAVVVGLVLAVAAYLALDPSEPGAPAGAGKDPGESAEPATGVRPLDNDCAAGAITLTFDDGPGPHTDEVMRSMEALGLTGVFFVLGHKVQTAEGSKLVRGLVQRGFPVENHSHTHRSFTGASTGERALTRAEIVDELERASEAIVEAGGRRPTLYRPPYGDIDERSHAVAAELGYRIVMPWGRPGHGMVDSRDWAGDSAERIVRNVTRGRLDADGFHAPARDGSIVLMHDGQEETTRNLLAALQPIVDWMNRERLCATHRVRPDATGGVVPLGR